MRKIRTLAIAATLFAGALAAPAAPAGAGHTAEQGAGPFFDLDALPEPDITGKQIWDGLVEFVDSFPIESPAVPRRSSPASTWSRT